MKILYLIPARGGSKGISGKNIKLLNGRPLLYYSLNFARNFAGDDEICLSTDDPEIAKVAEEYNYLAPFIRPPELATDESPMQDVILHALNFYESMGKQYDAVFLLQPTSPFRLREHAESMLEMYEEANGEVDMIASVGFAKRNPYFNLFEEGENGWLERMKKMSYASRQQCPDVYYLNGSMYIYKTSSLKKQKTGEFKKIRKFVMGDVYSIDIDTELDWMLSEAIIKREHLSQSQVIK
jgi:N-acylneuraminate cytidylyltransferase